MNVNGRLGADAIQRMQQAQQTNAPQVEGENEETSQTVRKPLSKSEVAGLLKGKLGEPTKNVNTGSITTQEAQAADHNDEEPPELKTQYNNIDDLYNHGKNGDFCLSVNIINGQIHYILTYLSGGVRTQELTEEQFNALQGFDGQVTGW